MKDIHYRMIENDDCIVNIFLSLYSKNMVKIQDRSILYEVCINTKD